MALPKLNDVPMYTMIVPSTKKEFKYRPFLVREQKVLLLAYESQDRTQIINAILECINSCTNGEIDSNKLPMFDIDYIFTQIRTKSVGEKAELNLRCNKCDEMTPFTVDLSQISIPEVQSKTPLIELTEDIKVQMRYPTYKDVMSNTTSTEDKEFAIKFVLSCIQSVQTPEENIDLKDETLEEKTKFIESLTNEQFEKINKFVNDIPKLTQTINVKCEKCGEENSRIMEGVENFF